MSILPRVIHRFDVIYSKSQWNTYKIRKIPDIHQEIWKNTNIQRNPEGCYNDSGITIPKLQYFVLC